MLLKVIGPVGDREERYIDSHGLSLGAMLRDMDCMVRVNDVELKPWGSFVPRQGDVVEVTLQAGITAPFLIGLGVSAAYAATVATVANLVISLVVSMALSALVRALSPKPKKPKLDSNAEQAFGIGGFANTKGKGTPAFVPYGLNRVWGHVISSGAVLSADGKQMSGRVLYFMGDTGGDGLENITDLLIDGTSIDQYPEVTVHTRSGTDPQTVIPEFENLDSLFSDGRGLSFVPETQTGTPIVYTTRGTNINRATLFIAFPGGLYRVGDSGKYHAAGVNHLIEIRNVTSGGVFSEYATAFWTDQVTSGTFKTYEINFPSPSQWDVRITTIAWTPWVPPPDEQFIGDSILFNVQETVFTTKTYPGWALLGLTGIPAKRIQSLENVNVSALVYGKRVRMPNGIGTPADTLAFTRKRCWIVRDMMTHPVVGMGSEIDASEIDSAAMQAAWYEAQNYYDELVQGHDGMEERDLCDVIVGDSDWDWEWVKKVAGEARGRIIPSGTGWKYVVDKPGTPNLLYTEGANIVDGSISQEIAPPDKPFTEISAEFRDAEKEYERNFSPVIKDPEAISTVQELQRFETITRESEIQRENMIVFKRNFLERRRWQWMSPMGAIVSEPMDLDYFAERGIGGEGAYGGILPSGSTTANILLPDVCTLQAGATYALIVKHRGDNTTEYRIVTTGAGNWGMVTVDTPFIQAPAEGDAFSLGIQDVEHIVTRAHEREIDPDGRVKQVRTEYIPAVYTQDPLPPKSVRRFFNLQDRRPPIPLRDAQVREEVALNKDGSTRSMLVFDVTPGLPGNSGIAVTGSTDFIALAAEEPGDYDFEGYFNDYYKNARITITGGPGAGQVAIIRDYFGQFRVAFFQIPLQVPTGTGSEYTIQWDRFGEFGGFRVETSEDGVNFVDFVTVNGTHMDGVDGRGAGPGTVYFRFTPFSANGVENLIARITRAIALQGDLSAPDSPSSVDISSHLLAVMVSVYMDRPVAEDFSGVEVELWRDAFDTIPTNLLSVARFGAPADHSTTGTMRIECPFNAGTLLPPVSYGTLIARARSVDYSDNRSVFQPSNQGTVLASDPTSGEIPGGEGPPAVPQGLALSTGTIVDPFDGVIKPFLDITWFANTEPDISRYEVHYREKTATPVALTVRMISHPQISTREIGLLGGTLYEVAIQAIDTGGLVSGFTAFIDILIAHDVTPPPPPVLTSIIGGFEMISLYFNPPPVQDFAFVEAWISPVNDWNSSTRVERSAPDSISIRVAGLGTNGADTFVYYVWLRAFDTSGNVSGFNVPLVGGGTPVQVRQITGADVAKFSALITEFAQIETAVIQDAHIHDLSADKITAGTLRVFLSLGVGGGTNGSIFMDGSQGPSTPVILIYDQMINPRVQLGKLGAAATDWGLQLFGPGAGVGVPGPLWFSITQGILTAGRQNQNEFSTGVSITLGDGLTVFTGVFPVSNTTSGFTIRVTAAGSESVAAKGGARRPVYSSSEYSLAHGQGKTMAISPSLTNIVPSGATVTATLLVHYW